MKGEFKISRAETVDLEEILGIYSDAREFMRQNGNSGQWQYTYPDIDTVKEDIAQRNLYKVTDNGKILAVFFFRIGEDETYIKIYNGSWLNQNPYGAIHRVAVSKDAHGRGIAKICFDYCFEIINNIKIDTHRDNIPMQKALLKSGFKECGIIYLKNGDSRVAFQRSFE